MTAADLRAAFRDQARSCAALGSPFTARLLGLAADRLTGDTPIGMRLLSWTGDVSSRGQSVPLRFAGCLHRLVIEGDPLALHWPPHEAGDDDVLWDAVEDAMARAPDRLNAWLDSPPQTNEIRRAAAILPALHMVSAGIRRPIALLELGASAGLNLLMDRIGLRAGDVRYGPADPPFSLMPDWRGQAPWPDPAFWIAVRRGVDLRPLRPADPADRSRLMSYLWPDQPERRRRTEAALAMAHDVAVDAGDAGDWLAAILPTVDESAIPVVFHTVAWQYFPPDTRAVAERAMATAGRPLVRIAMEADGGVDAAITLTLYPEGRMVTLGRADFHGRRVDWTGGRILD